MARKSKTKKKVAPPEGKIYISTSYNNTIVTVTDKNGNAIISSSAGQHGFKGTKKGTAYAAGIVAGSVAKAVKDIGMEKAEVLIKGPGSGRETAIRSIQAAGLKITAVRDITPVPHDGCKPRKKRRV